MPPALSMLVLSEDTSEETCKAIVRLVRRILVHIEPTTNSAPAKLELRPAEEDDVKMAMRGNGWRQRRGPDHVRLVKAIATKLAEPGGFVAFHFDADQTWRDGVRCPAEDVFDNVICVGVKQVLEAMRLPHRAEHHASTGEVAAMMQKVLTMVPRYEIESWLFQNTVVVANRCDERRCGEHRDLADKWSSNRTLLDDVEKPKDEMCFEDAYNLELATTSPFPLQAIVAAGRSLAATVAAFSRCQALRDALLGTAL